MPLGAPISADTPQQGCAPAAGMRRPLGAGTALERARRGAAPTPPEAGVRRPLGAGDPLERARTANEASVGARGVASVTASRLTVSARGEGARHRPRGPPPKSDEAGEGQGLMEGEALEGSGTSASQGKRSDPVPSAVSTTLPPITRLASLKDDLGPPAVDVPTATASWVDTRATRGGRSNLPASSTAISAADSSKPSQKVPTAARGVEAGGDGDANDAAMAEAISVAEAAEAAAEAAAAEVVAAEAAAATLRPVTFAEKPDRSRSKEDRARDRSRSKEDRAQDRADKAARRKMESRPKTSSCLTAVAFFVANCWIISMIAAALLPQLYDGFNANEIDYWYPLRICPRTQSPSYQQFDSRMPFPPGVECTGANAPCQFPFQFTDSASRLVTMNQCITTRHPQNASNTLTWCPTEVDDNRYPLFSGECSNGCKQMDFTGSTLPICQPTCPTAGVEPTPVAVTIDKSGWGGPSGFNLGAPYSLVLFTNAQHLSLKVKLQSAGGRLLYDGNYTQHACQSAVQNVGRRARRLAAVDEPVEVGVLEATKEALGSEAEIGSVAFRMGTMILGPHRLRQLLERRSTWLDELGGATDQFRPKEGEAARWAYQEPVTIPTPVGMEAAPLTRCALNMPTLDTVAYVMGACDVNPGTVRLPPSMTRAELGEPFTLEDTDFPLLLTASVNASLRGAAALAAADGTGECSAPLKPGVTGRFPSSPRI